MFGRRRRERDESVEDFETEEVLDEEPGDEQPAPAQAHSDYDRAGGPYDVEELDDTDDDVVRVDVGGLRVPVVDEIEVRLDVDQNTQQVAGITVVHRESSVQLTGFAAPRHEGLWADVRKEIAGGIGSSGGTAEVARGVFGPELLAMLPAQTPQGGRGLIPARFVGIDGPRWFLRGLYTGPAARESAAAAVLDAVLRGVVVVRGTDPMAPGDPLPLHLPEQVPEGLSAQGPDGEERRTLPPPERGPEITEIR